MSRDGRQVSGSGDGASDTGLADELSPFRPIEVVEGFPVIERMYSDDPAGLSVGLANVSAEVPDIEANKKKIVRIAQVFKERGVNFAVFPEFSLSGYFWEDEPSCRRYMREAAIENHTSWVERELKPLLDDQFQGIVLNNVSDGSGAKFFNRTFIVTRDLDYLDPRYAYDKVFLPGIEKTYTQSGGDDRLVLTGERGRFGFTTCYDCLFSELLREYALVDRVDAIVEIASWRAAATRDYPGLNVRTDHYYGDLWDTVLAAAAAVNQRARALAELAPELTALAMRVPRAGSRRCSSWPDAPLCRTALRLHPLLRGRSQLKAPNAVRRTRWPSETAGGRKEACMRGVGRAVFVAVVAVAGTLNIIYGIAAVGNAHFFPASSASKALRSVRR